MTIREIIEQFWADWYCVEHQLKPGKLVQLGQGRDLFDLDHFDDVKQ